MKEKQISDDLGLGMVLGWVGDDQTGWTISFMMAVEPHRYQTSWDQDFQLDKICGV